MTCDVADRSTDVVVSRCSNCGHVKAVTEFSTATNVASGLDSWCHECRAADKRLRTARARSDRIPSLLGQSDPRDTLQAVSGALRVHYDGRVRRLLRDLRLSLNDCDPVVRVNAALVLIALRELALHAEALRPKSPVEHAMALPESERIELVRRLLPGWTITPP